MSSRRSAIALSAMSAAILIAAAGIAGFALRPVDTPRDLAAGTAPLSAPAAAEEFIDERSVQVRLTIGEPARLPASRSGTLTATWCTPGTDIVAGTIVATINYAPVYAMHTDTPLYRSLGVGERGEDVRVLQRELTRLGFAVEETGYYGWETARAVREMKLAAGSTDGDDAYRLDLAEIVWLAGESLAVSECPARVGQALGPGDAVAIGPGTIQSVAVEPLPVDLTDGERVLTVLGASGIVGSDGVSADPQFLEALLQAPEAASVIADPSLTTLPARIQLATPIAALKVPPAAVFGVDGDRGCIQSEGIIHAVTVIGASLGNSLVGLDEGTAITTVDLGAAIRDATCNAAERVGQQ
jgi:peptidoglycan hydrolase-like protein with peptidoglycan-binding domain